MVHCSTNAAASASGRTVFKEVGKYGVVSVGKSLVTGYARGFGPTVLDMAIHNGWEYFGNQDSGDDYETAKN